MQGKSKAKDALIEYGLAAAIQTRALVILNTSIRTQDSKEVLQLLQHAVAPQLKPPGTAAEAFFEEHAMQVVLGKFAAVCA